MCIEARGQFLLSFTCHSPDTVFHWPEARHVDYAELLPGSMGPRFSATPTLGLQMCAAMPSIFFFQFGFWRSSTDLHVIPPSSSPLPASVCLRLSGGGVCLNCIFNSFSRQPHLSPLENPIAEPLAFLFSDKDFKSLQKTLSKDRMVVSKPLALVGSTP